MRAAPCCSLPAKTLSIVMGRDRGSQRPMLIYEAHTSAAIVRLRGGAPCAKRLVDYAPHGRQETIIFRGYPAATRNDRDCGDAPFCIGLVASLPISARRYAGISFVIRLCSIVIGISPRSTGRQYRQPQRYLQGSIGEQLDGLRSAQVSRTHYVARPF